MAVVQLLVGMGLLVLGGEFVVRGGSEFGRRGGLSPMTIGLTIVALGTSAPELAVSLRASLSGNPDLAMGNVVGSNIANVLLVLGLTATLGAVHVASRVVRSDVPIVIAVSVALFVFALGGRISRVESAVLVGALVAFVIWTLRGSRSDRTGDPPAPGLTPMSLPVALVMFAAGIGALVVAARLVVSGAGSIAEAAGVPDLVVGLTVVAVGTSAPEIATSLVAATRGQRELAVGNALGSNVLNVLLVIGTTGLISSGGLPVADNLLKFDLPVMLAAAIACLPVIARGHSLERWEGVVFVGYYVMYTTFLVVDALDHPFRDPVAFVAGTIVVPLTLITFATLWWRHRFSRAVR